MSTPKTLADMTHEEQTQCVGMWCDFYPGEFVKEGQKPQLGIIADWHLNREEATILNSGDTVSRTWSAGKNVTPRFDLPRAWNPDGAPVVADPEEYTADERSRVYFEGIEKVAFPPGTKVRRWVSDWEVIK